MSVKAEGLDWRKSQADSFKESTTTTKANSNEVNLAPAKALATAAVSATIAVTNLMRYQLNKHEVEIVIEGFQFHPNCVYVHKGTHVKWLVRKNQPVYSSLYDATGPRFFVVQIPSLDEESDPIHEEQSFQITVDKLGEFQVICSNYMRLKGRVCVVDKKVTLTELLRTIKEEAAAAGHTGYMEQVDDFKYSLQPTSAAAKSSTSPAATTFNKKEQSSSITRTSSSLNTSKTLFREVTQAVESVEEVKIVQEITKQLEREKAMKKKKKQKIANNSSNSNKAAAAHYLQLYHDDCQEDDDDASCCSSSSRRLKRKKRSSSSGSLSSSCSSSSNSNRVDQITSLKRVALGSTNVPIKILDDVTERSINHNIELRVGKQSFVNEKVIPDSCVAGGGGYESDFSAEDAADERDEEEEEEEKHVYPSKKLIGMGRKDFIEAMQNSLCKVIGKKAALRPFVSKHLDDDEDSDQEIEGESTEENANESEERMLVNKFPRGFVGGSAADSLYLPWLKKQQRQHQQHQQQQQHPLQMDHYDCNVVISEEDTSAQTSKDNSVINLRRNNSSSTLHHSSRSGVVCMFPLSGGGNWGGELSLQKGSSSSSSSRRPYKWTRRGINYKNIQSEEVKKCVFEESLNNKAAFLLFKQSPAQSTLTTAESSKYSDTTKQFSQRGDFETEHGSCCQTFSMRQSLKRRASTDQSMQDARHMEDSDTRSIKSLNSQPNTTSAQQSLLEYSDTVFAWNIKENTSANVAFEQSKEITIPKDSSIINRCADKFQKNDGNITGQSVQEFLKARAREERKKKVKKDEGQMLQMTSEVENTSKKNKQQQEDIAFLYDLMQTRICVESWLACDEVVDESAVDELVAIN